MKLLELRNIIMLILEMQEHLLKSRMTCWICQIRTICWCDYIL